MTNSYPYHQQQASAALSSARGHGVPLNFIWLMVTFLLLILNSSPAAAGIDNSPWHSREGQLFFKTDSGYTPALRLKSEANLEISGITCQAKIRQHFTNDSASWMEGIYTFPLPESAAITNITMHIGKRLIQGRIKEKQEAKKTYEKAKKEGKKASLLNQQRPNIFTMKIANIGPGETISVELTYHDIASYDNGLFSLRFPTVIGPRFIPAGPDSPDKQDSINPPVLLPGETKPARTALTVKLDSGFNLGKIESLFHEVDIQTENRVQTINLTGKWALPDRDFVLQWQPVPGSAPQNAFFSEKKDNENYSLCMIIPPEQQFLQARKFPRELIFILDVSGSMSGTSIVQAKEALKMAISRLNPGDTFNIITFNDNASQLFRQARKADQLNIKEALSHLKSLEANGGTIMRKALELALFEQPATTRLRQIIFLTDGCVGNEAALFDIISNNLGDSRLFTIGIGSAPNSFFMETAARHGRGTFTYIGKTNEVREKMTRLMTRLETPALTDIRISLAAGQHTETSPNPIPDLYPGEPVVFTLKTESLPEKLTLSGSLAGSFWQTTINTANSPAGNNISTLWARRKIDDLTASRHIGVPENMIKNEITALALQHHLVSKYTSLVAVDISPSRPRDHNLTREQLKGNLPAGWQYNIATRLPQTGTISLFCLVLGSIFISLSFTVWLLARRRFHA